MLKLMVAHLDWEKYEDGRQIILAELKSSYNSIFLPRFDANLDIASFDCVIIHASQESDVDKVKRAITAQAQAGKAPHPYLITFGGTVTTNTLVDGYGCCCDMPTFIQYGSEFFSQWQQLGKFPGWEALLGDVTLDAILELLMQVLPFTWYIECGCEILYEDWERAQNVVDSTWSKITAVVERHLLTDNQVWQQAQEKYNVLKEMDINTATVDILRLNLEALRDVLIDKLEPLLAQRY